MKRITIILLCAAMLFCLTACSRAVGGKYALEYITMDGVRVAPSGFGMNISFELAEDGVGTASYGATTVDITWAEDGGDVVLTSPEGVLRLARDGKDLILHSEGTMLFFTPVEEAD